MLTRTLTACSRSSTKSKMTPRFLHTFEQSQNSNSRSCNHVMLCVGVVLSNLSYQQRPYVVPTEFNHKIILFLTLLFLYFFLYPKQINGNNKQASFPVRRGPRRGPGWGGGRTSPSRGRTSAAPRPGPARSNGTAKTGECIKLPDTHSDLEYFKKK